MTFSRSSMNDADAIMTEISTQPQADEVQLTSLLRTSAKRTREVFASDFASPSTLDSLPILPYSQNILPFIEAPSKLADEANIAARIHFEYADSKDLPPALAAKQLASTATTAAARRAASKKAKLQDGSKASDSKTRLLIEGVEERTEEKERSRESQALVLAKGRPTDGNPLPPNANGPTIQDARGNNSNALIKREAIKQVKPEWHPPWKLMKVISGHLGWVRALAVEPGNKWFASGAGDRTIKIWDLASGQLRLTLTGHISTVRGLAVSPRHPYLFSCGEDKMVKCWDLETNKVIRHYHGHLSGVYTLDLHPTLDVLVTGGRDGVARVWDMRTRSNIHVLSGHKGTVSDVKCQDSDPQVISASLDSTIRLWDLAAGKTMGVLTHHKKGVRALALHPREFTFASGSTGSIKQWKCPEGALMANFDGQSSIINTLSVTEDDIMFSGGDDGSMCFWDWKSGFCYQRTAATAQPGSLEAERGVFASRYDLTGMRLITGEADKTIKIWGRDDEATEESNPLDWRPTLGRQKF